MRCLPPLTAAVAACALALAPAADAAATKTTLTIRGGGWGHGVGMSQYGARGYAAAGRDYRFILGHYYSGTRLAQLDGEAQVRVLLAGARAIAVAGVDRVGRNRLDPARTYTVVRGRQGVVLRRDKRDLFTGPSLVVRPPLGGTLVTGGARYHGVLELTPLGAGVQAVNVLGLEDYVRGVVPREIPSTWPPEALKAQAVAARTYAIADVSPGATLYADTRSQVYGGASAETTATNAAVAATAGQVVTYAGVPAKTYFFSSSGGRTENIEYAWPGATPRPWLRSVDDPYDVLSPYHRWGPLAMSGASAQARRGSVVKGRFRAIRVIRRGASPRVVSALVVGTRGTTPVSGPRLRAALDLRDTWAYFTSVTTGLERRPARQALAPRPTASLTRAAIIDRPGGAATLAARARTIHLLAGAVVPGRRGLRLRVQRLRSGRWHAVAATRLDARGRYAVRVAGGGTYRVAGGGATGPAVTVG